LAARAHPARLQLPVFRRAGAILQTDTALHEPMRFGGTHRLQIGPQHQVPLLQPLIPQG